jgi:hypothetical protein
VLFLVTALTMHSEESISENSAIGLKTVRYREAVSFMIPRSWIEEDEPGLQGTFFEPGDDTGTLRVSVMQWTGTDEEDRNRILKAALLPGDIEVLKQGVYLKKEVKPGEEEGDALSLYRWIVALALPENVCRVVVFTHTVTKSSEEAPETIQELEVVDFAVRNAVFSYEPRIENVDDP